MQISLIVTVYNEAESIKRLLSSVENQTRLPDEMVIVDGGSTDGTPEIIQRLADTLSFPLRLISAPGLNIAEGRNKAIKEAHYQVIAVTDAGVLLDADWLRLLSAPFEENPSLDVVGGFFVADAHTSFEKILGATTLPDLDEIDPTSFCPSSRSVAFTRKAWEQVGGYPEWLDYCEDLVFDFGFYDKGLEISFVPRAVVNFRPRANLRAFWRQYYRYARGDGKAQLYVFRHLLRYMIYGVLVASIVLSLCVSSWFWTVTLFILLGISATPARRLHKVLDRPGLSGYAQAIGLRIMGDFAKMVGYPAGMIWNLRGNAPKEPWPRRRF